MERKVVNKGTSRLFVKKNINDRLVNLKDLYPELHLLIVLFRTNLVSTKALKQRMLILFVDENLADDFIFSR